MTDDASTDEAPTDDPTPDARTGRAASDGGADVEAEAGATERAEADRREETDVREYLLKGALAMLVVLGVVATLQFYLNAQAAIADLASEQFREAFIAAFNLVVLLAVGIGLAQVVRRLA